MEKDQFNIEDDVPISRGASNESLLSKLSIFCNFPHIRNIEFKTDLIKNTLSSTFPDILEIKRHGWTNRLVSRMDTFCHSM